MKPTEEHIDQALRKALQQRFDLFEAQPSGRLSSEVLSAIRQSNTARYGRFAMLLALILLCGLGTLGVREGTFRPGGEVTGKSATVKAQPGGTLSTMKQTGGLTKITRSELSEEATSLKHYSNAEQRVPPPGVVTKKRSIPDLYPHPAFQKPVPFSPVALPELDTKIQPDEPIADTQIQEATLSPPLGDLQKLRPRSLLAGTRPATPIVGYIEQSTTARVPRALSSAWRGVVSFTPTNTYQRLTVLPQDHVRYQNFELPALFSVQTAGFDLRGGVEKKGFQVLVQYSRFTQKLAYEVALDQYLVQPNGNNTYTVAQGGMAQAEEITFQLVGLSLQKKFSLPAALPGFYVSTGATLSHDLTTSHNLAWGTLGIGKSWPVAPTASLSLIPQVGFGLNSVTNQQRCFQKPFLSARRSVRADLWEKLIFPVWNPDLSTGHYHRRSAERNTDPISSSVIVGSTVH